MAGIPLERRDRLTPVVDEECFDTEESRGGWTGLRLERDSCVLEDEGRSTLLSVLLVACAVVAVQISASKSPYVETLSLLFLLNRGGGMKDGSSSSSSDEERHKTLELVRSEFFRVLLLLFFDIRGLFFFDDTFSRNPNRKGAGAMSLRDLLD
jgi:hypothetical protein